MYEGAAVISGYLAPYSPDLNAIEESFVQLKQWIAKNGVLAEQFQGDDIGGFLQ